jgi:hypothetical protein
MNAEWIDRIVNILEENNIHTRKVECGWSSPSGAELPWQHWVRRGTERKRYV